MATSLEVTYVYGFFRFLTDTILAKIFTDRLKNIGDFLSEVNKRGRPSKWPPECLPSKFAYFECAFSL